jgi:GNAT superfamily N-acetyltransferase
VADTLYVLREHRPGDLGAVIALHGRLYAEEYGWDISFEALVAGICKEFIDHFDPMRERAWIAEMDGEVVGSVFCVKQSEDTAKLRMLILHPKARGLGLGKRLVAECDAFAKDRGYRKIVLWTHDILKEARGIYERAGYGLMTSEPTQLFGQSLNTETWEKVLV